MSDPKSRRLYAGPAILSLGFRPFFLLGALWAVVAVMLWLPQYFGELSFDTGFQPLDWHAHEALFGYIAAIVTGFLLTAVPNWTGRLPLQGRPLTVLLAVWLAGRIAVAFSGQIGWVATALVDCAFLALVCAAVAREIVAGKNTRNLKVLFFVGLLFAANVVFHVEAHIYGSANYGRRFGVAATIALIMLIGGRVIPSFTHTFLARRGAGRLPIAFNRFDGVCVVGSTLALAGWVLAPENGPVGLLLIAAGLLNLARLARWAGDRALGDPLVADPACRLCFRAARLCAERTGGADARRRLQRRPACLGGRRCRRHDAGGDDPRQPRPYRAGSARRQGNASDLRSGLARGHRRALPPRWRRNASFVLLHVAAFAWSAAFLGFIVAYGRALWSPRR